MEIKMVEINKIKVKADRRTFCTGKASELANSIRDIGLINPITITKDYWLITGQHRLHAYTYLGEETIPAIIIEEDNKNIIELQEIDENLIRKELHYTERSKYIARRKEIYEMLYPESKPEEARKKGMKNLKPFQNMNTGAAPGAAPVENKTFVEETAQKTGKSETSIREDVQIGTNISNEALDLIKEYNIPKKESIKIARLPADEQFAYIENYNNNQLNIDTEPIIEQDNDNCEEEAEDNTFEDGCFVIQVHCKDLDEKNFCKRKLKEFNLDFVICWDDGNLITVLEEES